MAVTTANRYAALADMPETGDEIIDIGQQIIDGGEPDPNAPQDQFKTVAKKKVRFPKVVVIHTRHPSGRPVTVTCPMNCPACGSYHYYLNFALFARGVEGDVAWIRCKRCREEVVVPHT